MPPPALGRFTAKNVTLNMLVRAAYQVRDFQITGGAGWTESERYDVEVKAEGNPNRDQLQLMLRTLLADRFQLRVHPETRDLPIYELKVTKRQGPNLHAVENSGCLEGAALVGSCGRATFTVRGQVTAEKASMSQVAQIMASITGRTVLGAAAKQGASDLPTSLVQQNVLYVALSRSLECLADQFSVGTLSMWSTTSTSALVLVLLSFRPNCFSTALKMLGAPLSSAILSCNA